MSVKSIYNTDELILTLDNGDKKKFEEVLKEWNFKDEESLIRFFVSIAKESNDKKTIAFKDSNNSLNEVTPASHLVKDGK
jgi:hypothetical protein